MPTKYYDPSLSTGDDDGSTEANAWRTLQKAADTAVAGDKVLCKYNATPEAVGADVDFDTNSGAQNNPIEFVGVNGSWVEDGTQCTIDGEQTANYVIEATTSAKFLVFRNMRAINAARNGFWMNGSDSVLLYNCTAEGALWHGFAGGSSSTSGCVLINCRSINNLDSGFYRWSRATFIRCAAINNGSSPSYEGAGISCISEIQIVNCVVHNNGVNGVYFPADIQGGGVIVNSVIDGNTGNGMEIGSVPGVVISGCRITNNTGWGVNHAGGTAAYDHNVIVDNLSGTVTSSTGFLFDGGGNITTGAAGYVDRDNDNFTTATDAQLRREAVTIG